MSVELTVEDFRPCLCGHGKWEHRDGATDCGRIGYPSQTPGGTICGCCGFEADPDEPYVEVASTVPMDEYYYPWIGGAKAEALGLVSPADGVWLLRPSDIAYLHWKAQHNG